MSPKLAYLSSLDFFRDFSTKANDAFEFVEIYAFMQHCGEALFQKYGSSQGNILSILAQAAGIPGEDRRLAEALHKYYSRCKIIGFSTFLPELTAHAKFERGYSSAQRALIFLLKTALLNKLQNFSKNYRK